MAVKIKISTNTKRIIAKIKKIDKKYIRLVTQSLTESGNEILKNAATKQILPKNATNLTSQENIAGLEQQQFKRRGRRIIHPSRLTGRSGFLQEQLDFKKPWVISSTGRSAKKNANKFLVAKIGVKGQAKLANWTMKIGLKDAGDPKMKFRLLHEITGGKSRRLRKFLEPAHAVQQFDYPNIFRRRTRQIRNARI